MAHCGPLTFKNDDPNLPYPVSLQHLHGGPLVEQIAPGSVDWSFLIVRHPVARLISEYRFQKRKPRLLRDSLSFGGWLHYSFLRQRLNPWYRDNHFRMQTDFLYPDCEIFRFEDSVDDVVVRFAKRMNQPTPAARIHEKKSSRTDVELTQQHLDRIAAHYKADLDYFGYGMDKASLKKAGVELPRL